MVKFSRSLLARTRECLADALTHKELSNLFDIHNFTPRFGAEGTNKLQRCSAHLDHHDWTDPKVNSRLNALISEVRVRKPHFFEVEQVAQNPTHSAALLLSALKGDGYSWDGNQYILLGTSSFRESAISRAFDLTVLAKELHRAKENTEKDPDDAITAAENIVVSAAKHVLDELEIGYSGAESATQIFQAAIKALKLVPDEISDSSKGADSVKKILRSLVPIVQGIAELRNLYGDSHGKGKSFKGLKPRHARLMVGAAETISTFLLEALADQQAK